MKKVPAPFQLACSSALLLIFSGCNYAKPMMYVDVDNRSGHPMENLEVKDPDGTSACLSCSTSRLTGRWCRSSALQVSHRVSRPGG